MIALRGATAWEAQVGRVWIRVPFPRFWHRGVLRELVRIAEPDRIVAPGFGEIVVRKSDGVLGRVYGVNRTPGDPRTIGVVWSDGDVAWVRAKDIVF